MTAEQRIARALYEIERQRTSGEWNLCKVRDLLTGEEPAALREHSLLQDWMHPREGVTVLEYEDVPLQCGVLYTPPTPHSELLAAVERGTGVRAT